MSTLFIDSNVSLDFTNIPLLLQLPIATTIASGVAKPSAHGHATTKTLTNARIDWLISFVITKFNTNDIKEIKNIVGTKYPLILSAILAIGAFVFVASTTIFTILEILESLPIFSALYSIYPS